MKFAVKLPLYLGLAVLVFSVLISVIKVGNQQAFTSQKTRANVEGASLVLKYTSPNIVSVILSSDKEVTGTDVSLKFNADKIKVLPSTLHAGPNFVTSGGTMDEALGTFSFSAIAKKLPVTNAVVASFTILSKEKGKIVDADIQFVGMTTTVIDKAEAKNILKETQGAKFTLPSQ